MAAEHSCILHIHTSETRKEVADCHAEHGMYPVEYLDSIGYFHSADDGGTVCAHCGWVTKKEMGRTLGTVRPRTRSSPGVGRCHTLRCARRVWTCG